jgi:outer membrane protein OmpA-like peptidoglycan-associated protein
MKHLKMAVIALFTLVAVSNVNAQDENNPWVVGFGTNIVDFYGGDDFSDQIKDLMGNGDWNFLPSISRFTAEKYLEKGFSLQLAGSLNKITTLSAKDDVDFLYYSLGANVKYDLNNLIGETPQWFDPYVYLGGDYVSADSNSEGMLNVGAGFNTWFNDNVGLTFQTGTKKGFSNQVKAHYQSSLGLVVKFGGKDTDGDGVYDKKDACPEIAGLVEFNGCPDADGDGIKDSDDACPNVAGLAAMNGCPDADGDGIADKDDMCPNSKGTKANNGCPDTDGDGLVDKDDKCSSLAGPAANAGCPWPETDGDSILDKDDKCPSVAGIASEGGCPEVISNEAQMGMNAFANAILFNTGRASFKSGATNEIDGMLAIMNQFPTAEFAIKGFTDTIGSASNNLKLSDKRANAVRDYLVENGIAASRLTAEGFGEENPIDTNMNRAGRANNRRVEVKVTN